MCGQMGVRVECWPIAADTVGLWLVSGHDAWRGAPIAQDGDVHFEVENLLAVHAARDTPRVLHSTSWRPDGPHIVLTYVAVLDAGDMVLDRWPDATPLSVALLDAVGPPPAHAADAAPTPRYVDVLLHAVRHLRFLYDTDTVAAAAFPASWGRHLDGFAPALAGMYAAADA